MKNSSNNVCKPPNGLLGLKHLSPIQKDYRQYFHELAKQHGDLVPFHILGQKVFLASSPELAHQILVSQWRSFKKAYHQKQVFRRAFGEVSFILDNDVWAKRRKMMNPVLSPQIVNRYQEIIIRQTNNRLAHLTEGISDVSQVMSDITLTSVAEALFGTQVHDVAKQFREHVMTVQDIATRQMANPFTLPMWIPTRENRMLKRSTIFFKKLVKQMFQQRRASSKQHHDLLTILINATQTKNGYHLSEQEAVAEAVAILFAGNDTSSAALNWSMYLLAKHPEIQNRVYEEAQQATQNNDIINAPEEALPYTTAVFKEAIRLYPPTSVIMRQATEQVTLGDTVIPKGAFAFILVYTIHHDARWFPEPETFDPERFLPAREKSIPQNAYLPFSLGPQACVGRKFVMLEGPLILAELIRRYRLTLPKNQTEPKSETQLSLHPKGGMFLNVERRTTSIPHSSIMR